MPFGNCREAARVEAFDVIIMDDGTDASSLGLGGFPDSMSNVQVDGADVASTAKGSLVIAAAPIPGCIENPRCFRQQLLYCFKIAVALANKCFYQLRRKWCWPTRRNTTWRCWWPTRTRRRWRPSWAAA